MGLNGTDINELHISVHTVSVTSPYVLQIGVIASGRTEDYVSHISDSLTHDFYTCKFFNLPFLDARSTILKHLKNTS